MATGDALHFNLGFPGQGLHFNDRPGRPVTTEKAAVDLVEGGESAHIGEEYVDGDNIGESMSCSFENLPDVFQ